MLVLVGAAAAAAMAAHSYLLLLIYSLEMTQIAIVRDKSAVGIVSTILSHHRSIALWEGSLRLNLFMAVYVYKNREYEMYEMYEMLQKREINRNSIFNYKTKYRIHLMKYVKLTFVYK